ncbi:ligase-associated DNA damage response DEXH box helicase [Planctomicrobium piriforme]|uniref:ATP-dependent helicase Lhr and Lhr-like helicase n=1 Tax=Planctomicrobium piriforme TaxID=1576369 RepID=A0A1I3LCC2_9PLAN|nr:ligase-associated DNA damage response DEXH box helicase [Planctomicrobium piriforme]SFI82347.1 ATP-dependent helicase Lhr and Lhr-like helicase [Planctomicrobium piriforme]
MKPALRRTTTTVQEFASAPSSRPVSQAAVKRAFSKVRDWFKAYGWKPFPFQTQAWQAYLQGDSGLLHATTGTGKTYAAWLGPVIEWLAENDSVGELPQRKLKRNDAPPLRVLWITPLRALSADTLQALLKPIDDLQIHWTLETRTGDTSSSARQRQRQRLPTVLITTPESLSLLLTRPEAREQFADLRMVVVDEWHELLATKRGVQTELALARLRHWTPGLRTWGLSATLGNLGTAMTTLVGHSIAQREPRLIQGLQRKQLVVDSIIPRSMERFPWSGHLGLRLLPEVIERIEGAASTLVFTNTRSQTEIWYQAILKKRPDWAGQIALHHGSIDQEARSWVEQSLRTHRLKCVVCTASLDLGVDFSPVDQVLQIGSPKGVARLLQRAGRSGHGPGRVSRVTCVPTNAFELIETAAARDAIKAGRIEAREPVANPVDVLVQHAVTIAVGGGFHRNDLLQEIRTAASYATLDEDTWDWVLDFITRGGAALSAYPNFHRVRQMGDWYVIDDQRIARQHRMSIGTITSDAALTVQFLKGPRLGTVEESFLAKLNPGDRFTFAGRLLELVSVRDMKVYVRKATGTETGQVPRWMGGRMPLSTELAEAVRAKLSDAAHHKFESPEMQAVQQVLELQQAWSHIPLPNQLLIEQVKSREGHHLYFYPFAGRLVHEGLAALLAWRLAQHAPLTFSLSANDYGFELLSHGAPPLVAALQQGLLSADHLADDIGKCLNAVEMGKRQFREIARIAGLVFDGFPGQRKTAKQLQASSGLLYDVFVNYDPANLLLAQAAREVLERQLERTRLAATLETLSRQEVVIQPCQRFTPLSFPLMVDRLRSRLSSEKIADRIARMQAALEKAADQELGTTPTSR